MEDRGVETAVVTLGQKIRAARLEQRLTQEQLGGRDFTKSYISEIERDNRTPRLTTLKILARRLGRPLSYLLDGVIEDREAEALLMVGLAHFHAGSLAEAEAWFNHAVEAAADSDELLQARIELALANVEQRLGRDLRAWRRVERVLRVLTHGGDRRALIGAQACLGQSKLAAGDVASAAWTFEAALQLLSEPATDPSQAAALHCHLGIARELAGQTAEAAQAFRKALAIAEAFADSERAGAWHVEQAAAAATDGRFETAIARAGEAIAVYDTLDHKRRLAEIHWRLGDFEARAERWQEAQRHYSMSIATYGAAGCTRDVAQTLGRFVEALRGQVPPEAARAIGETALALLPNDGGASGVADDDRASRLWLRGTIQRILGRLDEARASLTESLRLFESLRRSETAKAVRRTLALLAVESNDLAAAREYLSVLWESPQPYRAPAAP
ncbi:MAG TPA: helix-turn-helix domain-containing protein [bacterium]|nr:helix-turn-helix domain-containing protein [bacterium]